LPQRNRMKNTPFLLLGTNVGDTKKNLTSARNAIELSVGPILMEEQSMGRIRTEKWSERIIDIDILLYGNEIISSSSLIIPHPQLPNRRFALEPLAEIAPHFIHPVFGVTIVELLDRCADPLQVWRVVL
jgi:2-amino-4-hydroxy-6-hydroxymethyldihydropteridine diphosphokinase